MIQLQVAGAHKLVVPPEHKSPACIPLLSTAVRDSCRSMYWKVVQSKDHAAGLTVSVPWPAARRQLHEAEQHSAELRDHLRQVRLAGMATADHRSLLTAAHDFFALSWVHGGPSSALSNSSAACAVSSCSLPVPCSSVQHHGAVMTALWRCWAGSRRGCQGCGVGAAYG